MRKSPGACSPASEASQAATMDLALVSISCPRRHDRHYPEAGQRNCYRCGRDGGAPSDRALGCAGQLRVGFGDGRAMVPEPDRPRRLHFSKAETSPAEIEVAAPALPNAFAGLSEPKQLLGPRVEASQPRQLQLRRPSRVSDGKFYELRVARLGPRPATLFFPVARQLRSQRGPHHAHHHQADNYEVKE